MRLALALFAQLAFFAGWGVYLLGSHANAPTIWLETEPVDPRDLLSGHYVALRYPMSTPAGAGCDLGEDKRGSRDVYVLVEERGRRRQTSEGEVAVAEPVACSLEPPSSTAGQWWIAGRLEGGGSRIAYGIERFYVGESSPLRRAQTGSVVARIAVSDNLQARIVALVDAPRPTEPAAPAVAPPPTPAPADPPPPQ